LAAIEEVCRYKTFAAGTQVFDRNAETRDVFFVVRGRVRIVNYSLSGREITLDVSDEVTDRIYASIQMSFELRR